MIYENNYIIIREMVAFSKLPVMMSDEDVVDKRYENGKIYLVKCKNDDTLVYVGSTYMSLEKRFSLHKNSKTGSLYKYVNDDWDNWYIELYEEYPCKNKHILELKEGEVQRDIATINKNIAGRTHKQYLQDNFEKISEQKKQYRQDNLDKLSEYNKQHYQDNREKYLEQKKQYRQDNREKISEKNKQKIKCERCGSIFVKCSIKKHQRSQKCLNYNVNNN
jgi:hypothetical protein